MSGLGVLGESYSASQSANIGGMREGGMRISNFNGVHNSHQESFSGPNVIDWVK